MQFWAVTNMKYMGHGVAAVKYVAREALNIRLG